MNKIAAVVIVCLFVAGSMILGNCHDGYGYESGPGSDFEQSESAMDQNLDSEMGQDRAQNESDMQEMDESMDTGGQTSR